MITALLGMVLGVLIALLAVKVVNGNKKFDGDYNRWRKLNLILQEVQKNYVDTIKMSAMTDAAVVAALAELDPHSVYLPPVELTESETELSGNFEGVGIVFNVPNDTAIVINVVPGGPSQKAGLLQGDRIIRRERGPRGCPHRQPQRGTVTWSWQRLVRPVPLGATPQCLSSWVGQNRDRQLHGRHY